MPDKEQIKTMALIVQEWMDGLTFPTDVPVMAITYCMHALLKEQEEVKAKKVKGYNLPVYAFYGYECENCGSPIMTKQPYCMGCGRKVKWE